MSNFENPFAVAIFHWLLQDYAELGRRYERYHFDKYSGNVSQHDAKVSAKDLKAP